MVSSVDRAVARRVPRSEWGRGSLRLRLYPPDHPTADVEIAATIVGGTTLVALALLPLGTIGGLLPACRFHEWTGWPCATCGIARGLVALGAGRGLQALRFNPLFIGGLLVFLAYAVIAAGLWFLRLPRPRVAVASRGVRLSLVVTAIGAILLNWAFLIVDGR